MAQTYKPVRQTTVNAFKFMWIFQINCVCAEKLLFVREGKPSPRNVPQCFNIFSISLELCWVFFFKFSFPESFYDFPRVDSCVLSMENNCKHSSRQHCWVHSFYPTHYLIWRSWFLACNFSISLPVQLLYNTDTTQIKTHVPFDTDDTVSCSAGTLRCILDSWICDRGCCPNF